MDRYLALVGSRTQLLPRCAELGEQPRSSTIELQSSTGANITRKTSACVIHKSQPTHMGDLGSRFTQIGNLCNLLPKLLICVRYYPDLRLG